MMTGKVEMKRESGACSPNRGCWRCLCAYIPPRYMLYYILSSPHCPERKRKEIWFTLCAASVPLENSPGAPEGSVSPLRPSVILHRANSLLSRPHPPCCLVWCSLSANAAPLQKPSHGLCTLRLPVQVLSP